MIAAMSPTNLLRMKTILICLSAIPTNELVNGTFVKFLHSKLYCVTVYITYTKEAPVVGENVIALKNSFSKKKGF